MAKQISVSQSKDPNSEEVFKLSKVSRYYRYDWQYAVDISKRNSLTIASLVILIVPIVLETKFELPFNLWLLWISSVAYVISLVILNLACPKFIQEYRDFGSYKQRRHSHRFIVWEFFINLRSLKGWKNIVKETKAKQLCIISTDATYVNDISRIPGFEQKVAGNDEVIVEKPENIDRNIFLPIILKGEKILLAMKEDDRKLAEKEKELFWILFSQAVKEKTTWRVIYWVFIFVSIIASFLAIFNNIRKVIPTIWNHIGIIIQ